MNVYEYLKEQYRENEPIFVKDLKIKGVSYVNIRQQLKKLTDANLLKRYDFGIYFIPKKSIFRSDSQLSRDKVIEKKYLKSNDDYNGYVSGVMFANQIGITSQVPMVYEVVSNRATKDYRETELAKTKVVIRRPRTTVNNSNYKTLQFLDLLKDIDDISEVSGTELKKVIAQYMKKANIESGMLEQYIGLYPDKIFKNMYETGILHGLSTQ